MAIELSSLDLLIASGLVLALAGLTLWQRLGLTRTLLVSAIRTTVQLSLVGFILKALFEAEWKGWLIPVVAIMLAVAGYEVMRRTKRRFTGWWGYGIGTTSMLISSFTLTLFALIAVIGADPWYLPQYAIPLLGMSLGNTMNGISLGLSDLTQTAWRDRRAIEGRLLLGATWQEAIFDVRRQALRTGMIPIINSMAVAGIVSLPGMMTGQILAGEPPANAVRYQILIMFLIAAGTGFGTLAATWLGARRLFDDRHRLRLERLKQADR